MTKKKLWQQGMPFGGEMMVCKSCGKEQKSDPKVESGWTAIQADNEKPIYICPDCWNAAMKGQSK
jgi:hypothetical protein